MSSPRAQVICGGIAVVVIVIFLAAARIMNGGGPVFLSLSSDDNTKKPESDVLGILPTAAPPETEQKPKEVQAAIQQKPTPISSAADAQGDDDRIFGVNDNWLDDLNQTTETTIEERVMKLPMAKALRQFHISPWETVKEGNREIMCALLIMASQNCDVWRDTLASCVLKHGVKNFYKILGARCTHSDFWREMFPKMLGGKTANAGVDEGKDAWKKLKRGIVWDSGIMKEKDKAGAFPYVPPAQRNPAPHPPPRVCSNGCKHYPIGIGLPQSVYEKSVTRTKNFAWMPLMPKATPARGAYEAKIEEEDLFREMYKQSYFAFGHQRGGYSCMREHDAFSAGTIPIYWDIDRVPVNTMGNFPKNLMREAMNMPGVDHMRKNSARYVRRGISGGVNFNRHGEIQRSNDPKKPIFNLTRYYELADQLHAYAYKYMTTRAMAAYVLKAMNAENATSVVIFTRSTNDYVEITLIHGFGDLGIDVTVVSAQGNYDYFYFRTTEDGTMTRQEKDNWLRPQHETTYGAAYGFSSRLMDSRIKKPWIHSGHEVLNDIKAKKFDVALWQLAGANYEFIQPAKDAGTKVGFLQYRDLHGDPDSHTMGACAWGGTIFVREMSDRHC